MHIEEEILKHLRAQEEDRQRQVKLRAESLDRYIELSAKQFEETMELLGKACEERDSFRRKYIAAVVTTLIAFGITAWYAFGPIGV